MPKTQQHASLKTLCEQAAQDSPVYFDHEGRQYALLPREKLERLEDRLDVLEAREVLAKGETPILLEEVMKMYGLVNDSHCLNQDVQDYKDFQDESWRNSFAHL